MSGAALQIDKCVHCGFCLPACPTYLLDGEEMDSPRGRIYLLKAVQQGRIAAGEALVTHFDRCLGCLACVSACPSGVDYGPIVEEARQLVEQSGRRTFGGRVLRALLFRLLPHPGRLRLALLPIALLGRTWRPVQRLLKRVVPRAARPMVGLAPSIRWSDLRQTIAERTLPEQPRPLRVAVVQGCVQRVLFARINAATVRVLAAEGCEVWAPAGQGCCGALAAHAGREADARLQAQALIAALDRSDVDHVVINAAGCGSTMKGYGTLFADDPVWSERAARFSAKVRDVSELLDALDPPFAPRHELPLKVAYHDACHLAHGQGIRTAPRRVLGRIPGVELVPLAESEVCCGSAGIYNLIESERADRLGMRKAAHVAAAEPEVVATGNPGCMLQIAAALEARGRRVPVVHPIEIIDASIRGESAASVRQARREG